MERAMSTKDQIIRCLILITYLAIFWVALETAMKQAIKDGLFESNRQENCK